ncbi:MAG: rod shape-determining protein RodA [Treponema sp.]|jgi:rod shape determining protein RodA|nr:rod shape-determining protein RodA [Treponema sp.]
MRIRDLGEIDFFLLFASLILSIFGVLFIYSSGITSTGVLVSNEYIRQIIWASGGIIIALLLSMVDYKRLRDLSLYFYLATLALLVYTCFFGRLVNGARAWIGIGAFGIQPSEFAKITTILFLARYLDDTKRSPKSFSRFVFSCLIVFIPMGIVLIQPDFGTSLVFIPILLVMTFIAGVSTRYIIFLTACIALTVIMMVLPLWQIYILHNSMPALLIIVNPRFIAAAILALLLITAIALFGHIKYKKRYFYWIVYSAAVIILSLGASFASHKVLKDYQIMRLIVFLDPDVDPRGAGWNIIQSITAIGSGGLAGKGYLQGTQSHYRFLPQQSTDFIFSIFTEEWGLLGGLLVFALFLLICLRLVRIMRTTSDAFGSYICAGLSAMYIFHFLINVGMTMGIMPITGIPLLFMSYGGSAVISAMTGIGLALSIYVRRYRH